MDATYVLYALLTFVSSLAGGLIVSRIKFTHNGLQILLSFVGGLMLSVAILHLLPHAVQELEDDTVTASQAVLVGIVVTFILLRVFHVHQHGPHNESDEGHDHDHQNHRTEHSHTTASEDPDHCEVHSSRFSWIGLFIGLGIHALVDGITIAAIILQSRAHDGDASLLPGLGVAAAIILHKPLDSMSVISVMKSSGWDQKTINLWNLGFASISPLGIYIAGYGLGTMAGDSNTMLMGCTFGFTTGCFLTIALSDILPELTFHSHDRLKLTAALIAGMLLGMTLQALEPNHGHGHNHSKHNHSSVIPYQPSPIPVYDVLRIG
ncbi:MAG: hypothetical protein CMM03_01585 [Rhodopirellula sp.]|nr:hypothetical protein [Rhodopirellula sp.]